MTKPLIEADEIETTPPHILLEIADKLYDQHQEQTNTKTRRELKELYNQIAEKVNQEYGSKRLRKIHGR